MAALSLLGFTGTGVSGVITRKILCDSADVVLSGFNGLSFVSSSEGLSSPFVPESMLLLVQLKLLVEKCL